MNSNKTPRSDLPESKMPGHWLLAKLGKKVLRPGGKEMTQKLVNAVDITNKDVVEFAPGLGWTANLLLNKKPKSYIGIEADQQATDLSQKIIGNRGKVLKRSAHNTQLGPNSADILIGEAMLSMHGDLNKLEIMKEAFRVLREGGYYVIHELGLKPDDLNEEIKRQIQKELSQTIRVNARPQTIKEWTELLSQTGFEIVTTFSNGMHLLELHRIIDDEGWIRTIRIIKNALFNPSALRRVIKMKSTFSKYRRELCAVGIIAKKPNSH